METMLMGSELEMEPEKEEEPAGIEHRVAALRSRKPARPL